MKDLDPISNIAISPFAIAAHPSIAAATLQEFIDYDKANRGKLSYGHAGVGSLNHLTGELFKSLAGLPDLLQVPYRGSGPAIVDALAGHVAMVTPAVTGQLIEFHRTGKLRILAVTSPNRLIAASDLPTAAETLPDMISQQLIGLFAPAGTAKAKNERHKMDVEEQLADNKPLEDALKRVLKSSPSLARIFGLGQRLQHRHGTPPPPEPSSER